MPEIDPKSFGISRNANLLQKLLLVRCAFKFAFIFVYVDLFVGCLQCFLFLKRFVFFKQSPREANNRSKFKLSSSSKEGFVFEGQLS